MRADRRLYLDVSQTRLVPEAEAAFLLAAVGHEIPADAVKRLGLVLHEGRVMQGAPEPVAVVAPVLEPVPVVDAPVVTPILPPEGKRSRKK